jgi:hypothetical protein
MGDAEPFEDFALDRGRRQVDTGRVRLAAVVARFFSRLVTLASGQREKPNDRVHVRHGHGG